MSNVSIRACGLELIYTWGNCKLALNLKWTSNVSFYWAQMRHFWGYQQHATQSNRKYRKHSKFYLSKLRLATEVSEKNRLRLPGNEVAC